MYQKALLLLLSLVMADAAQAFSGVIFSGGPVVGQPTPYGLSGQVPALCQVHFEFTDDDHHVLQMKARPSSDGELYHYAFHDNEPEANGIYGPILWHDLSRFEGAQPELHISDEQTCNGQCEVAFPPIEEGRTFALTGFQFEFPDHDRHLLEIEIRPVPSSGLFLVNFRDNGYPEYRVRISTVTFQREYGSVVWKERASLSTSNEFAPVERPDGSWKRLLQGFHALYMNGDHELQEFNVNVCDDGEIKGVLRDKDGVDDPYRLDIWYLGEAFRAF